MTKEEAYDKLQRYCAYQDRCHQEVRTKLLSLQIYGDWLEEIMSDLIDENFLNEERFAINYARGKYRIKGWGKNKILRELKARRISDYCIKKAMKEVDDEGGYNETLQRHLEKYIAIRKKRYKPMLLRKKAIEHGVNKGFEYALVKTSVDEILKERA